MTESSAPIRVLLVEDNDVYRDSLVFLLGTQDRARRSSAQYPTALRRCAPFAMHEPDVVVLDYRLPDVDGATVAADIRGHAHEAAVVFLSASAGTDEYDAASSAGAALVRKDEGIDALVRAIRAAAGR